MTRIIINRSNEYINHLVPYTVYLDDRKIGYVENGKSKSFEISQGEHILYCKIDWARSNKIKFTISGEEINFNISGFNHSGTLLKYGIPLSVVLLIMVFFIPFRYTMVPLVILALPLLYYTTAGYKKYLVLQMMGKNNGMLNQVYPTA
jgi:hypothetical protein